MFFRCSKKRIVNCLGFMYFGRIFLRFLSWFSRNARYFRKKTAFETTHRDVLIFLYLSISPVKMQGFGAKPAHKYISTLRGLVLKICHFVIHPRKNTSVLSSKNGLRPTASRKKPRKSYTPRNLITNTINYTYIHTHVSPVALYTLPSLNTGTPQI